MPLFLGETYREKLVGPTTTPTTMTSLEAATDTHHLPLLLSILDSPYPQLAPLLVSSDLHGGMV